MRVYLYTMWNLGIFSILVILFIILVIFLDYKPRQKEINKKNYKNHKNRKNHKNNVRCKVVRKSETTNGGDCDTIDIEDYIDDDLLATLCSSRSRNRIESNQDNYIDDFYNFNNQINLGSNMYENAGLEPDIDSEMADKMTISDIFDYKTKTKLFY